METNVGILAIGNEVVEGQVVNHNAAWLSEELTELGANPVFHLTCRDQNEDIQSSLNFLSRSCHLIIVCGGLGPTKDDFTRQSLSQWLGLPLEVDEEQWTAIMDKLANRGLALRDGHKNQALRPKGALSLPNSKGVAPGFVVKAESCFLATLPGPPGELQAMFKNFLKPYIQQHIKPKSQFKLRKWICLGVPESEVAHITESILGEEFPLGYRLHRPYVEVKAWTPLELSKSQNKRLNLLNEKLAPWLVGHDIKKIRQDFHTLMKNYMNVFVIDHLTEGLFLEKLKEDFHSDHIRYQCFEHKAFRYFSESEIKSILSHIGIDSNPDSLFISLFPASERSAMVAFNNKTKTIEMPVRMPIRSKLGQLLAVETCFLWKDL